LTVATTARTTRFCRTRIRHFAAGFDGIVHVAIEIPTRRTSQRRSSARGHGLTGTTRPARTSHADAAASIATRLAIKTTTRSPLKDEPGWPTHTTKPNFGKVEYFCAHGLTPAQVGLSGCFV
jgi:hypothetical protein